MSGALEIWAGETPYTKKNCLLFYALCVGGLTQSKAHTVHLSLELYVPLL